MIFLLVCSMMTTEASIAQGVKYIPLGTPAELNFDGRLEVVRCYRLGEFKLLMKTDLNLQDAEERLKIYQNIESDYSGVIEEKDKIIEVLRKDRDVLEERAERMETNWHDAEQRAIGLVQDPIWPYIVAGIGAVVGVVGTTLYLSEVTR